MSGVSKLYISGRERKIVEALLKARQAITMSELASELEVSNRTIHRDLINVEEILSKFDLTLGRKSGSGLEMFGHEEDKESLALYLSHVKHTDYTPEERQTVILLTLLEASEPIKLYSFVGELHVTVATISNDLNKIEVDLSDSHLSLIRRRGFGIKIEGNESDKRRLMSHLIMEHLDEFDFISLLNNNIQQHSKRDIDAISNRLLGIVHPEKLQMIEQEVEQVRAVLPYGLADRAYIGLVVHLALAIERLQQGDTIEFDRTYLKELQDLKEYQIAEKMLRKLEKTFNIIIPVDEVGYITMHLLGAKSRVDHDYLLEESNLGIAYKAKRLIDFVSVALAVDLTDHDGLLNDLVIHLRPTIYRLKQKMNIKNPLIAEILTDYQELFQVVKKGVNEVFPHIEFPKEEIGYLVLHFGSALQSSQAEIKLQAVVICPSGIGTAKMLAERLLKKIPEIKHVENKSLFELDLEMVEKYDLIVSTIPLQGIPNYILASPILTKTDIENINKEVKRKKLKPHKEKEPHNEITSNNLVARLQSMQDYARSMLDVVAGFYVGAIGKNKVMAEILADICNELGDKQVLDDREQVYQDLRAREKNGGLGIPGTELALYHARTKGVHRISFSMYTLGTPVEVEGMDGQRMESKRVLLMVAPIDSNPQELEILSLLSGLIIRDEETMRRFESATETELQSLISTEFNQFLNEQQI